MRAPKVICLALWVGAALAAVPSAVTAQEKKPVGSFRDTAQVNLVNVEVVVIDKAGHHVIGLRPEDFEVLEDGVSVPITNFYSTGSLRTEPAAGPPASEPPTAAAPDPAPPPLEQRLSLVLFVDNVGITPAQRNIALRQARALVQAILRTPHAEVMVVAHGLGTKVFQKFTNSAPALEAALTGAAHQPTDTAGTNSGRDFLVQVMSRTLTTQASSPRSVRNQDFDIEDARSLLEMARGMAREAHERARAALASMDTFISSLAGLPGRKVICYIGNGIPMRPGAVFLKEWESRFGSLGIVNGFSADLEAAQLSVSPEFHAMVARANADRVTFYSIDATGGDAEKGFTADHEVYDTDPTVNQGEAVGRAYSLEYLADATGGSTLVSTPEVSPDLARFADDFGEFYSLAYAAPHIGDGKDHAIKVRVKREGVRLRYRRHYLDKTADERMADRNLTALLYEAGSNGLDVGVVIGKEERQTSKTFLVSVMVSIPLGRLVLVPKDEVQEGSVSIWLADKDDEDRVTPPSKRTFPVHIPTASVAAAMSQNVTIAFKFLMKPGPHMVAVSVRDDTALIESTVTARFSVGTGEVRGPGVLRGLLMLPPSPATGRPGPAAGAPSAAS